MRWMRSVGTVALVLLALFLLVVSLYFLRAMQYVGSGVPSSNTISVSGEGEVFAVPDIATFSVTVLQRADTVEPAQTAATEKANAIIAYLRGEGIDEKDIKTVDYSVHPRYEYQNAVCREGFCPPGEQVLAGYEVSQTLTVKVRDTAEAGGILSGVGSLGASSVSGLSFTIDEEDDLKSEARGMAIDEAEDKARELARQLGVRLIRIVGFSEDGSQPYYAYGRGGVESFTALDAIKAPAPELPVGENKIISYVTITYEIR